MIEYVTEFNMAKLGRWWFTKTAYIIPNEQYNKKKKIKSNVTKLDQTKTVYVIIRPITRNKLFILTMDCTHHHDHESRIRNIAWGFRGTAYIEMAILQDKYKWSYRAYWF